MRYGISNEDVNIILFYLKTLIVNLGAYCIYGKLINNNVFKIENLKISHDNTTKPLDPLFKNK